MQSSNHGLGFLAKSCFARPAAGHAWPGYPRVLARTGIGLLLAFAGFSALLESQASGQEKTREEKVREDRQRVEAKGIWLYNDLPAAYRAAAKSDKPILAVLRCVPCEECVKLDDELIDTDPQIAPLLDEFVCVRLVGTNGLDLTTFQYDTDQSFAVFFLNADKTVYGRFGTRSHRTEWVTDVSVLGLGQAMQAALALHRDYPQNREQLRAKSKQPTEFNTPEQFPTLDAKPKALDYAGEVAKSCIHCHQIGEARIAYHWKKENTVPDHLLFPYPHPKSIGLILDPDYRARIKAITPDSAADHAGLQAGDDIQEMQNQPLISMADVQWVLHNLPMSGTTVPLVVDRAGQKVSLQLSLENDWKQRDETSWRTSHWILRRAMLGGMKLTALSAEERERAGLEGPMALRVSHLGNWGPHGAAKRAGFQQGDVLVEFDGQTDLPQEADVFAYASRHHRIGDTVLVKFLRDGKLQSARLPIQE